MVIPPMPANASAGTWTFSETLAVFDGFDGDFDFLESFGEVLANASNSTLRWPVDGLAGRGSVVAVVVAFIMMYGTPVIILIGLFGNTLSLVVFSCTHLERASSSLYMCLLSVADICFLGALLVVWLDRVGVSLLGSSGWCQVSDRTILRLPLAPLRDGRHVSCGSPESSPLLLAWWQPCFL